MRSVPSYGVTDLSALVNQAEVTSYGFICCCQTYPHCSVEELEVVLTLGKLVH
jgi:hypothetical protein